MITVVSTVANLQRVCKAAEVTKGEKLDEEKSKPRETFINFMDLVVRQLPNPSSTTEPQQK